MSLNHEVDIYGVPHVLAPVLARLYAVQYKAIYVLYLYANLLPGVSVDYPIFCQHFVHASEPS